jgi:integrase
MGSVVPKKKQNRVQKPPKQSIGKVTVRATRGPDEQGRWYYRLEWYAAGRGGKMSARKIGWMKTPEEALQSGAALIGGGVQQEEKATTVDDIKTLKDLLEWWSAAQDARRDLAPATRLHREGSANRLAMNIGRVRLDQLTARDLERYRDQGTTTGKTRRGQGPAPRKLLAPRTIQVDLQAMQDALEWGRELGLQIPRIPSPRIRQSRTYNHHTPTVEEVQTIYGVLTQDWHRAMLSLLWATGVRIGELETVRWRDIDIERGWMTVSGKTGTREVPLTPRARHGISLLERTTPDDIIWPGKDPSSFANVLRRACTRAGVTRFSPHAMRRLAVDELRRAGIPVELAATFLGHSPAVMLRVYRKPTSRELEVAIQGANLGRLSEDETSPTPTSNPYQIP